MFNLELGTGVKIHSLKRIDEKFLHFVPTDNQTGMPYPSGTGSSEAEVEMRIICL